MGVGGHFWDLLKPYARTEGFDFLRNKRVAVDLSIWIVQHETAIKTYTRNPHIRLTFFRTINLFSKFGAFPVFVVDGTPSPLKSQARIIRFFRASGIDLSNLPVADEGVSVERNRAFSKCVQECLEPFECYHMSDIEDGLGLKKKHLIAISLLVGNDHDLNGVQGIGLDTALRFVKSYSEYEILDRLHEIGRGDTLQFQGGINSVGYITPSSNENSQKTKISHCSICGHPGSKRAHLKFACEFCSSDTTTGCTQKPASFKCNCLSCDTDKKEKEQKKNENWQIKVCKKIAMEQNFPNDEIIDMYLSNNQGNFNDDGPHISWESPKTEMLVDYLAYHQHWDPSYIRQRMLPMLSTLFLREMASNPTNDLLYGQYKFDSIQRVKVRFGNQLYVVNWKKAASAMGSSAICIAPSEDSDIQHEPGQHVEFIDLSDEPDVPQVHIADGCSFLLTDEDMELVKAAFPGKVDQFLQEKQVKETKSRRKKTSLRSEGTPENSDSPTSKSVQLSIKEFYRSSKVLCQAKPANNLAENSENSCGSSKGKRNASSPNLSKSVRRRLLFG